MFGPVYNVSSLLLNLQMDSKKRTFTATVTSNEHVVELTMKFPDLYPNSIPPDFEFGKGTNIEKGEESRIIKVCGWIIMMVFYISCDV